MVGVVVCFVFTPAVWQSNVARCAMKTADSQTALGSKARNPKDLALDKKQRRWENALVVSLILAVLAGLAGLTVGVLQYLGFFPNVALYGYLEAALLITTFSAGFFAAHCLDRSKEATRAIRLENCRRRGLRVAEDDRVNASRDSEI